MSESWLDTAARFLAKQYVRARRLFGVARTAATPVSSRTLGTTRRKIVAVAVVAAVVLGGIGTAVGVSYANEAAAAAALAAETEAKDKVAAEEAAAELAEEQTTTRALLDSSDIFATAATDYAEAGDLTLLKGALSETRGLLSTGTTDELYKARLKVRTAVSRIGERPIPYSWSLNCTVTQYKGVAFETYSAVWASEEVLTECAPIKMTGHFLSDAQNAVLMSGAIAAKEQLGVLYGLCADLGFSAFGALPTYTDAQMTEIEAALTLCPDQPAAGALTAKFTAAHQAVADAAAAAAQAASDAAAGITFTSGVHRVGETVQAGTYVSEGKFTNCYWERTASDGSINDNFFTMGANRVEVTIRDSDYTFNSTGCGTWRRQ